MILSARDRKMIASECLLYELRIYDCSLGDMILSARDRKMITNECLLYDCFELRIYDCSLGDMILSARIASECLLYELRIYARGGGGGVGVLPYMGYIGMCRGIGYDF